VDETYIRVRGRWTYLYRAVAKQGLTVNFLLSERRDIATAKLSFIQAIKQHGPPQRITLDGYPATHAALSALKAEKVLPKQTMVRKSKYLNNLIEQDHRRVKQRVYPMLGFKRFANATITISGIELVHRIRKGQFDISTLNRRGVREPQIWQSV
jgi:transposase-like protein